MLPAPDCARGRRPSKVGTPRAPRGKKGKLAQTLSAGYGRWGLAVTLARVMLPKFLLTSVTKPFGLYPGGGRPIQLFSMVLWRKDGGARAWLDDRYVEFADRNASSENIPG
jgi:hypothetical protein